MLERFRSAWSAFLTPAAKLLLRLKVTPDMVTIGGTIAVVLVALICFPQGWLWQGSLILGFLVIADSLDGQMAKISGKSSSWGAFLDSSLDRLGDGAIFGGIVLFLAANDPSLIWAGVALWALVFGQVTSYVKARAESLGYHADGGLAARADRLLVILIAAFVRGLGAPYILEIAVSLLALASTVTVVQRMLKVQRQARQPAGPGGAEPHDGGHVESV